MLGRIRDFSRASPGELGVIVLLGLFVVGSSVAVLLTTKSPPPPKLVHEAARAPTPAAPRTILVHVAGMVARPGLYPLPEGSRVQDAITAAGGPIEGAGIDSVNLAAQLSDGQKVFVPGPGAEVPGEESGGSLAD